MVTRTGSSQQLKRVLGVPSLVVFAAQQRDRLNDQYLLSSRDEVRKRQ